MAVFSASFISPSQEYLSVLQMRNSYAFPILWNIQGWVGLAILLTPLFFYLFYKKKTQSLIVREQKILLILAVSFFVLIVQLLFTGILPILLFIQLQLGRIWLFAIVVSFVIVARFLSLLTKIFLKSKKVFFGFYLTAFILLAFLRLPQSVSGQNKEWIDMQQWVLQHTSDSCIFLIPFYSEGFRVYSHRSITGEIKDGALSFYSEDFAHNWYERFSNLHNWQAFSEEKLSQLQEKYQFSLAVAEISKEFSFKEVYRNNSYVIYQLPQMQKNCRLF